jgi:hypothetical protein
MQTTQLHEDKFFKVLWDEHTRIIGIDWKEGTSSMTDEDFKAALTLFAGHVEHKKHGEFLWTSAVFAISPARRYSHGG